MNFFQLLKSVLDELYDEIPAKSEDKRDQYILDKLTYLHGQYANCWKGVNIDYRDPAVRFAYIYCYTTAHASFVAQLIRSYQALRDLFTMAEVELSALGGGPGTELLAALKHIMRMGKEVKLRCNLFDREQAWAEAWADVDKKITAPFTVSTRFLQMDVMDSNSWSIHKKYLRSDLFTLVYFISEISANREQASPYFRHLFDKAVPGSLFLYIDNNNSRFFDWYDSLAKEQGLYTIKSEEGEMGTTTDEEKKDLGRYFEKFGCPKLGAQVAIRLHRKA
jgi:hypothetical protein